jgi:hypothetical protein
VAMTRRVGAPGLPLWGLGDRLRTGQQDWVAGRTRC